MLCSNYTWALVHAYVFQGDRDGIRDIGIVQDAATADTKAKEEEEEAEEATASIGNGA